MSDDPFSVVRDGDDFGHADPAVGERRGEPRCVRVGDITRKKFVSNSDDSYVHDCSYAKPW